MVIIKLYLDSTLLKEIRLYGNSFPLEFRIPIPQGFAPEDYLKGKRPPISFSTPRREMEFYLQDWYVDGFHLVGIYSNEKIIDRQRLISNSIN